MPWNWVASWTFHWWALPVKISVTGKCDRRSLSRRPTLSISFTRTLHWPPLCCFRNPTLTLGTRLDTRLYGTLTEDNSTILLLLQLSSGNWCAPTHWASWPSWRDQATPLSRRRSSPGSTRRWKALQLSFSSCEIYIDKCGFCSWSLKEKRARSTASKTRRFRTPVWWLTWLMQSSRVLSITAKCIPHLPLRYDYGTVYTSPKHSLKNGDDAISQNQL